MNSNHKPLNYFNASNGALLAGNTTSKFSLAMQQTLWNAWRSQLWARLDDKRADVKYTKPEYERIKHE